MLNYLKTWNFPRLLYLGLAVFIIIQGVQTNEWILMTLGGLFAIMALTNVSLCSMTGSCTVPRQRRYEKDNRNVGPTTRKSYTKG